MSDKVERIKGAARVQMSRSSDDRWRLTVTDGASGDEVVALAFTLEQFARALASERIRGVEAEYTNTQRIGWRVTTTHAEVRYPNGADRSTREEHVERVRMRLWNLLNSYATKYGHEPAQVTPRLDDVHNPHRRRKCDAPGMQARTVVFWMHFPPDHPLHGEDDPLKAAEEGRR